ncbi:TonB-dependent receptor [Fulvivirgaceae bacterium BMA12]|uniref:TonB-dependent receptor n=1 Tax=Agaribacillus aureus TaxID=3051825 RepID=A0ABT8LBG4_9BACT|nr:TonB-dependent receptor [Fulvivirgaceae bacterium BMA12]
MKLKLLTLLIYAMRLSAIGIFSQFLLINLLIAGDLEAQKYASVKEIVVNIDIQNASLFQLFRELEQKTKLQFTYDDNVVSKRKTKISITGQRKTVEEILLYVSKEARLRFKQVNNNINVNSLKGKSNENPVEVVTQRITITGKITDESGAGLPGVNVLVKNTTIGTLTDINGDYRLDIPKEATTLVFSYVGYLTEEVELAGRTTIDLKLVPDIELLSEVVVIGYGTAKKKDLTGAVVSFKPKDEEAAAYTSLDRLIQGKVAGVNISSTTAAPGAAISVTIRGANSLRGDNQPLYVVDNIPLPSTANTTAGVFSGSDFQTAQNPLVSINPQDIESIEVLKDASATAIYGSRGANGVIIITTKKGRQGNAKINFNYNTSFANAAEKHEMLGLKDYAEYQNAQTDVLADQRFFFEGDQIRYVFDGEGEDYNPNDPGTYRLIEARDWQEEIYRTAISHNFGLSVNGGTNDFKYYISGSYKDIQGIVKSTGLRQGTLRGKVNVNISDKLSVDLVLDGAIRQNDLTQGVDILRGTSSGSIVRTSIDSQPFVIPEGEVLDEETATTIFSWLDDYDDLTTTETFRGSIQTKYLISDVFNYTLRLGGNYNNLERSRWWGTQLFRGQLNNGALGISNVKNQNYTIENILGFQKVFNDFFQLDGIVGATYDQYTRLNMVTEATQFDILSLRTDGLHLANNVSIRPIQGDFQIASFLARTNVKLAGGKYIATVNFRADGSSRFRNDRWGYFPSMALAWKIDEEPFLNNVELINQFKLRVGYGVTGNQAIAPYSTLSDFSINPDNSYADTQGNLLLATSSSRLANPELTWETTTSYNLGTDFAMLDNRISGSIDVYRKTTEDLLLNKSIPTSNGFSRLPVNQGEIRNQGVELLLNGDIIKTQDLTVSLNGNIAFNQTKIIDVGLDTAAWGVHTLAAFLGNPIGQSFFTEGANIFAEGQESALFWGYQTDGIIQDLQDITYLDENGDEQITTYSVIAGGGSPEPGDVKFVDQNGDGVVDVNDRTFLGNPNPDFIYGFGINVSYKRVSLKASFFGVHGKDVLNANRYFETQPIGRGNIRKEVYDNLWIAENPGNEYPSINTPPIKVITDRLIEDGSFLRLTNITLNYQLPKSFAEKLSIGSASVFMTGKNLLLLTNYSGYDPEVNSFAFDALRQGIDWNGFPNQRSFTLGVNVNF